MFEGTLVASRGLGSSGTQRWTALGSVALQCSIAALLVAVPLLHPEVLPMLSDAPKLFVPPAPRPPVPPVRVVPAAASTASTLSVPSVMASAATSIVRTLLPRTDDAGAAPVVDTGIGLFASGSGLPSSLGIAENGGGPHVSVAPERLIGTMRVSAGVSQGLLLSPIVPVYPRIAVAARIEGAVVLEATISKAGRIESLRAVSGPMMLRGAALDAVQGARYRPYQLNGEPTEVQTTITVNFRLGS